MTPTASSLARTGVCFSLLVGATAAACAPRSTMEEIRTGTAATVRVDNQAFLDVNVYLLRSGQRTRLGTVTALTTRTFVLPRSIVGTAVTVQFVASFIGSSRAPVSEEVVVWEGDEVELRIPPG
ncbi:MAG: hypothetical protein ACSLFE_03350 [Gemmatimonadaceae bacterium]